MLLSTRWQCPLQSKCTEQTINANEVAVGFERDKHCGFLFLSACFHGERKKDHEDTDWAKCHFYETRHMEQIIVHQMGASELNP